MYVQYLSSSMQQGRKFYHTCLSAKDHHGLIPQQTCVSKGGQVHINDASNGSDSYAHYAQRIFESVHHYKSGGGSQPSHPDYVGKRILPNALPIIATSGDRGSIGWHKDITCSSTTTIQSQKWRRPRKRRKPRYPTRCLPSFCCPFISGGW